MGRESQEPLVIQSSIALLQERFRQLQRMREERELKKLLITDQPKQFNPTIQYDDDQSSRLYFHFLPPSSSPPPQSQHVLSLSLWPEPESKLQRAAGFQFPVLISSCLSAESTPTISTASVNKLGNSSFDDVDTSLHL